MAVAESREGGPQREMPARAAQYARITTNFIHDLSTGVWVACVVTIWTITSRSRGLVAEAAAVLTVAAENVFWVLLASLVGIALTGVVRLFYWRSDTPAELRASKRSALIVKHVLFFAVYGVGTAWAAGAVF